MPRIDYFEINKNTVVIKKQRTTVLNLVSFCTSLPVWQANEKFLYTEFFVSRVEIQNDKNLSFKPVSKEAFVIRGYKAICFCVISLRRLIKP